MKRLVLTTALVLISASAYAGTYNFEGVTVNVQDGCRSASCVAVNAPGYGSYNGKALSAKRSAKAQKFHKDTTRFASTTKTDAAPAAAAPAADTTAKSGATDDRSDISSCKVTKRHSGAREA